MGKSLIIKDADFSANGFFSPLAPEWQSSKAYVADSTSPTFGNLNTSSQFKASNPIAIPQVAVSLRYTNCIYTTGAGLASGYGLVFWDANGAALSGNVIPKGDRAVVMAEIPIPSGAKTVSFTYFMETDTPFFAQFNP